VSQPTQNKMMVGHLLGALSHLSLFSWDTGTVSS